MTDKIADIIPGDDRILSAEALAKVDSLFKTTIGQAKSCPIAFSQLLRITIKTATGNQKSKTAAFNSRCNGDLFSSVACCDGN